MIKYRNKQAGGTILGLIIGLIVGLGIAVVVAITIKNTPLPFVDKVGKVDRANASSKIADPNKSLYGNREPAKEAAKQFVKKTEEAPADEEVQQIGNADTKVQAPKVVEAKESATKAETKVEAKAASTEKAATDKPEEKFTYFLQAGAFLEQADAENTKAKLALLGFSASIVERQSDNGTLYRVRIGPFSQQETMNRMRTKLSDNGVDAAVVRIPK